MTAGVRRTWAGTEALRVLIVDDNRDAADSLAMLVTHWGYDARLAYGGAAALESALAGPPHVVLLDIGMPRMDGFRLASLMRKQTRLAGALLIAVTGYGDAAHRELWEAMFDIYLVKPVDPSTVEQLLLREKIRLAARSGGLGNNGCGPTVTDVALRYRARSG
ncbi:MAG TPA: response regulator [Gemmataceae bacterium]|nr:response regulator [Gemmataceae bacterium]